MDATSGLNIRTRQKFSLLGSPQTMVQPLLYQILGFDEEEGWRYPWETQAYQVMLISEKHGAETRFLGLSEILWPAQPNNTGCMSSTVP